MSSDVEISVRLRRLADQLRHTTSEADGRFDQLMVIHDELAEIVCELRREIMETGSR